MNRQLCKEDESDDQDSDGDQANIANMEPISNEEAANIFSRLEHEQGKKSYQAKKNWTDEEFKLLIWAINKYCNGKKISAAKLNKNDWI